MEACGASPSFRRPTLPFLLPSISRRFLHLPTPSLTYPGTTKARQRGLGWGNHSQNYRKSSGHPQVTRRSALLATLSQGCDRLPWTLGRGRCGRTALRFGIWEGRKTGMRNLTAEIPGDCEEPWIACSEYLRPCS